MNNIFNTVNQFKTFMNNPMGFISKAGIPQQYANNPDSIIQYLMNSGKISQQQYNQASNMAKSLQSNPQFRQFFSKN